MIKYVINTLFVKFSALLSLQLVIVWVFSSFMPTFLLFANPCYSFVSNVSYFSPLLALVVSIRQESCIAVDLMHARISINARSFCYALLLIILLNILHASL